MLIGSGAAHWCKKIFQRSKLTYAASWGHISESSQFTGIVVGRYDWCKKFICAADLAHAANTANWFEWWLGLVQYIDPIQQDTHIVSC